jgi:hypothetical protein
MGGKFEASQVLNPIGIDLEGYLFPNLRLVRFCHPQSGAGTLVIHYEEELGQILIRTDLTCSANVTGGEQQYDREHKDRVNQFVLEKKVVPRFHVIVLPDVYALKIL